MTDRPSIETLVESMPFRRIGGRTFAASEDEIGEIEDRIEAAIPPDYRWFIAAVGLVGTPSQWSVQAEGQEELDITAIFGGTDNGEPAAFSILKCIERFGAKLLDPGELFIGRDSFSNLYVLNAMSNEYRFVFLDGHRSIDLGATGLEEFLRLIKPHLPLD